MVHTVSTATWRPASWRVHSSGRVVVSGFSAGSAVGPCTLMRPLRMANVGRAILALSHGLLTAPLRFRRCCRGHRQCLTARWAACSNRFSRHFPPLLQLTLDIIGKAVFNYDFNSLTSDSPLIQVGSCRAARQPTLAHQPCAADGVRISHVYVCVIAHQSSWRRGDEAQAVGGWAVAVGRWSQWYF